MKGQRHRFYEPQSLTFGFSPGLKKCPLDTFLPRFARPPSSNPMIHKKQGYRMVPLFFYGVDNGIRTHDLQSHNLTR